MGRLERALANIEHECYQDGPSKGDILAACREIRAALAAPPAQEAVAWGIKWPDLHAPIAGAVYTNREEAERYRALWFTGTEVVPLYAHPTPPAQEAVGDGLPASLIPLARGLLRDAEYAIADRGGMRVGLPKATVDANRLRNVATAVVAHLEAHRAGRPA